MAAAPRPPRALPIVFALVAALGLAPTASAFTWNILEDRTGDATTIPVALTMVAAGDSVLVWPGFYDERPIDLPSDITFVSQAGASHTVLWAGGDYCIGAGRDGNSVDNVIVAGFTIAGVNNGEYPDYSVGRAFDVDGTVLIYDCIVKDNVAIHAGGHLRAGDLRIFDTVFRDNLGTFGGGSRTAGVTCTSGYLVIQGCTFENLDVLGTPLKVEGGTVEVRDSVFRQCNPVEIDAGAGSVLLYDSLFDRVPYPVTVLGSPSVVIRQNTFARAGWNEAALGPAVGANTVIDRNVFSGGNRGLWLCCPVQQLTCNVAWGNTENWVATTTVEGVDGNFSAPPGYCGSTSGDFTVAANSPLLPGNNSCGQQIGAFGSGCAATPVEGASFGEIKAKYRR